MRVLILANFGMGLYKFRKELLEELLNQKYEVYLSFPKDEYVSELEKLGCNIIDTPLDRRGTNPLLDIKLFYNYVNIIKQIKPDVVLTYTIKPNIFGGLACRVLRVPYIANITGLGSALEKKGYLQYITKLLYKLSLKTAKCIFFQNKENRDFFVKHNIFCGHSRLIPGSGVNISHFVYLDYPKDEQIHFMFISRVMKEKGIDHYLEAAEYIRVKYPNTRFHILGFCEEDYEDKLKDLQDKGIIEYHGMQRDIRPFLKISHCTIHPTYYPEGMSNVLLESAASGRPIITTNRSGCREIVDEGMNGFIVEQKNSVDLIHKIERFINLSYEEKKRMGLHSRKKVEREFDRNIVVNTYLEEINSILKR